MTAITATKPHNDRAAGQIDTRTPPYVRQTFPGQPIELLWGNEPPLQISDSSALLLAHLLTQFVLGNIQQKARANAE
jgi:hypothetical protein